MKKRYYLALGASAALLAGTLGLSACADGSKIVFSVDGGEVPQTLEAELGDLFVLPQIVAVKDGREIALDISVFDSTETEILLINQKFKATDLNGYTLNFTAEDGENTETAIIRVNVKDTQAPTFSIRETSGSVVLLNEEVAVPECAVNDASSDELTASYTVKDSRGNTVATTDGKFTASVVGTYTITYTARDASGNEGTKDFTVLCKKAVVLNGFEKTSDLPWVQFDVANKEVVSDPARNGNAVKVELADPQGLPSAWRRICVPFQREDGSYWTWEELQELEGIQCYVYTSVANEIGLMTGVQPIEPGWNTVYYSIDAIAAVMVNNPSQYQPDANGFFFNLRYAIPGSVLVFDHMIGIYADDYVADAEFTLEGGGAVPKEAEVNVNEVFTLPKVLAFRDKTEMTVAVTVKDSTGAEVNLNGGGSFTAVDLNGYEVTYTATDENGSESVTVFVTVVDTRIPQIHVHAERNVSVVGASFTVPESTVTIITGEELTATATVTDPSGNPITVQSGAFVTAAAGNYTITYTATSEQTGNVGRAEFTVICKEGKLLNGFGSEKEITFTEFTSTKEMVAENGLYGVKVTCTQENAPNWRSIRFPFYDEDGSYLKWDDLQDFAKIDIYIYTSANMNLGLANGVKAVPAGASVLSYTIAELRAAYDKGQYAENANGFYFNIQTIVKDAYLIFENVIAVYHEGYKPAVKATLEDGSALPERFSATQGREFIIPAVKAIRKKATEEMTVTAAVYDSAGEEVTLGEGKFTPTDLEGYVIVYTASDELGSEEFRIPLAVVDSRIPQIEIEGKKAFDVYKDDEVSVPQSTVIFGDEEGLTATYAVTDPDGQPVEVAEGKFTASLAGEYKIVYSFTAENGLEAEETVTMTCINGKLLNGFQTANSVEWCKGAPAKEVTADGLQLTWTAAGSWGRVSIPFRHADNTYMTWEEIIAYDRIEFKISVSSANSIGIISAGTQKALAAGENVITFTREELIAEMAANASTYAPNSNGLYTTVKTAAVGETFTFMSIVGYYAEETEEESGGETQQPDADLTDGKEHEV